MQLSTSFSLVEPVDLGSTRSSPSRASSLPDKARHLLATISLGSTAMSSRSGVPNKVQRSMHKAANKAAAAANAVLDSAKAAIAKIGSKVWCGPSACICEAWHCKPASQHASAGI